jgi:hypothetical protein
MHNVHPAQGTRRFKQPAAVVLSACRAVGCIGLNDND